MLLLVLGIPCYYYVLVCENVHLCMNVLYSIKYANMQLCRYVSVVCISVIMVAALLLLLSHKGYT